MALILAIMFFLLIVLIVINYTISLRLGEKFISIYMKDAVYADEVGQIRGVLIWDRLKISLLWIVIFMMSGNILIYILTGYFTEKHTKLNTEKNCANILENYIKNMDIEEKYGSAENIFFKEIEKNKSRYVIVDRYNNKYSMKDEMIANFAHDIKSPLTSIIGFLTLLEEDKDISEKSKKKYLETALLKSMELEKYMEDLFYIAKYDLEKVVNSKRKINLSILLNQILDEFYPNLLEKELNFKLYVDENISIIADLDDISKVFENIISNAIKYSLKSSDIIVDVMFTDVLIFEFSNRAEYISQKDLQRIFHRFYRTDKSRNPNIGGTGMGLAIAKTIIENMNGEISADYENGWFKITIKIPDIVCI